MIGMEIFLRSIPNDYKYKKSYLDKSSKNIEVLFLGSSHTYYGINPDYISKNAFNASHIAQSIDYDYEIFIKYKDNWKNLEYVVIPIDYFTFFSPISKNKLAAWRIKNYILYYSVYKDLNISNFSEVLTFNFKTSVNRIKKYILNGTNEVTCSERGYGVDKRNNKVDLFSSGEKAAIRHTQSDFSSFGNQVDILKIFLNYTMHKNIKVILYTTPAYSSYVDNLDPNQIDLTIRTAKELAERYENCSYHNLLSHSNFVSSDFRDADHLNKKGAKKLSLLINQLIE